MLINDLRRDMTTIYSVCGDWLSIERGARKECDFDAEDIKRLNKRPLWGHLDGDKMISRENMPLFGYSWDEALQKGSIYVQLHYGERADQMKLNGLYIIASMIYTYKGKRYFIPEPILRHVAGYMMHKYEFCSGARLYVEALKMKKSKAAALKVKRIEQVIQAIIETGAMLPYN
jgi:hypothetical protein